MREIAPGKVNLLLHVGPRRADGLHEICSLFAAVELADAVEVEPADRDEVVCPGVAAPNLAERAIAAYRMAAPAETPPVRVTIEKRIPVAGGMGGGSADAAAVLRALDALAGRPLGREGLRRLAAGIGADVPSQVEPRHALVTGAGEVVEPIGLPALELVLVPDADGLATADVYREADRICATRERLDPDAARALAALPPGKLAGRLENDLQAAALSLRPGLQGTLDALAEAGALATLVTGSGPTAFGLFASAGAAAGAAARLPGAIATRLQGRDRPARGSTLRA